MSTSAENTCLHRVHIIGFSILALSLLSSCGESPGGGARLQQAALQQEVADSLTLSRHATALDEKGPFEAGFSTLRFVDASRNPELGGRPIPVFVWYPVDAREISASTPEAIYPLDTLYALFPDASSSDFEAFGADRAYQEPQPSRRGPFPLVMFSPGSGMDATMYVYLGTRLASYGFVVAVTSHAGDGISSNDTFDSLSRSLVNRPLDVSFALTAILKENKSRHSLLHHLIDSDRIASAGHSFGGYAALALVAGDDRICDASEWFETPEPGTCGALAPDDRFSVVLHFEGESDFMQFHELARIHIPSMVLGREEPRLTNIGIPAYNARPHAAISARRNYRVDVINSQHLSYSNLCATAQIWGEKGIYSPDDVAFFVSIWCPPPSKIAPAEGWRITTEYSVAFLKTYLAHEECSAQRMLTPEWTVANEPGVAFYTTERGGNVHIGPGLSYLNPNWLDEFDYYDHMPPLQ